MELKLKSLTVTDYDSKDIEKVNFIKEVSEDPAIVEYVFPHPDKWLTVPTYSDKIESSCCYFVKDNDEIVGFFKPFTFLDTSDLGLDYAVHPKYRNMGYGSKILLEVSDYFFNQDIEKVILCIDEENTASIETAKKAGFTLESGNNSYIHVYEKRK